MKIRICLLQAMFSGTVLSDPEEAFGSFAAALPQVHRSEGFGAEKRPSGWEPDRFAVSPAGNARLLGPFDSGENATLRLAGLPEHSHLLIRLDLVIIFHWDGVWEEFGPDVWRASLAGGPTLLETTFSNFDRMRQNYPDEVGPSDHPARSGASSRGDLGWSLEMKPNGGIWRDLDTTYRIWLAVGHDADAAEIGLSGSFHDNPDPPGLRGERWALAGCEVRAVSKRCAPSGLMLRSAAGAVFSDGGVPSSDAVATLVLGGNRSHSPIQSLLEGKGHSALLPPRAADAGKDAERILGEISKDLGDESFQTREQASARLRSLLPRHRPEIQLALESATDPEVRERLSAALQQDLKRAEEGSPDDRAIQIGRLRRILRLQRTPAADRWLEHLGRCEPSDK